MFQNTKFNTGINFDLRLKKVYVENIPDDKIEYLVNNRNLKKDKKTKRYFFISWNVSSLVSAYGMFNNSTFNGLLGNWVPTSLENVSYMFSSCEFYNQPIYFGKSKIKNMEHMFSYSNFNNYINFKDLYKTVENMSRMFYSTYLYNKPIVYEDHLLFLKYNPKIRISIKNLSSVEGMFFQALKFNQSFGNINLNKKGINFDNFLNSAKEFDNIKSLQTMKIEKIDSTFNKCLESIKEPDYLDSIAFNKIKLNPEIIIGIDKDLVKLMEELTKAEQKLKIITDLFNYEIGILGVNFNMSMKTQRLSSNFLPISFTDYSSDKFFGIKNIFFDFNIDYNNMILASKKLKSYSIGGESSDFLELQKDDGKMLKYIFDNLRGESTEPQYNSLVHNSCEYLYHVKNFKYIESNLFPKNIWKNFMSSYWDRYTSNVGTIGGEKVIDLIIRSNLVKSFKELSDCMIFYKFTKYKIVKSNQVNLVDIYEKNENLKKFLDSFDLNSYDEDYRSNYLKKFEYLVNLMNYNFNNSGYLLGAYFHNITEKKPMPHLYRYNIETSGFTSVPDYSYGIVNAYGFTRGIHKEKFEETINSIDNLIKNKKYIYENINCNRTNTKNLKIFL